MGENKQNWMAARIEARRDLRRNWEKAKKSDFPRRKNVFFPMAGMDRSTLISQIKKKETILSMSFLVRLAFLNLDVTPTMEGGDPGATVGEPFKTNKNSIKTNKKQ